ncbi:uncharacterized protein LOC142525962 [Primulina tabacum]|uniref:uncharacterized protein LOC142525962 n=1 Tax=Primulina tabacum TaxID=48773 RepID=UPI003F59A533
MVQQNQFAGTAIADPHVHLRTFLEITDTVKINNVPDDIIRLHLFPFSLRDKARGWLQSLPLGSIITWQELATKFLSKYFSLAKSAQLKIEISTFRQTDFDQLYEACERSGVKRTAGVYAVDPITSLTAQVSALTTQKATMNKVSTSNTEGPSVVVEESQFPEEVQYINNKNFGGYGGYRGKTSFEDLVGAFVAESGKRMARTESKLDSLETHMSNIGASLKILESQVGQITKQLTSQPSDAVQKTADPNLREVNAVFIQHEEIGGQLVEKAICDSGASVNIMPSFIYEKLGLSGIKPTEVILQLTDKLVKVPLGCVENVELKIDKLRLPADFVVLDVENNKNVRIILGRPFLATAGAIIDLKQRKLTMDVEGQRVEIKASKSSHDPP